MQTSTPSLIVRHYGTLSSLENFCLKVPSTLATASFNKDSSNFVPQLHPSLITELSSKPAFEKLFKEHYAPMVGYALRMTKDHDLAEDLVQQVFVSLWEKREEVHVNTSLKSYLLRSVHNHCLNHFKHLKVRDAHASETVYQSNVAELRDPIEESELQLKVNDLIDQLPEQCRKVFLLSRRDGKKYKEIAEELNISVKTVENQMGKALRLMKEGLNAHVHSNLRALSIIFWLLVGVKYFSIVLTKQ